MSKRPRTIQIYLPKGEPRGLRLAELTTSIVRVVEVPRTLLDQFLELQEAEQVCVYLLINDDEDQEYSAVYIGQTGNAGKRLVDHHKNKEFWNRALVVVSLTNSLTQTHALYLEWLGIKTANEAGRYKVENGNAGTKPHTPAPMEADCQEIFDTLRTLVATLGQPVFEPLTTPKGPAEPDGPEIFYCKSSSSYDATAEYTKEGMVVLAGSKARKGMVPSLENQSLGNRRKALIDDGALVLDGNFYVFQRDVLFKSPSGAACVVRGASSNGWIEWVRADGKTLDALKRQGTMNKSES